MAAGGCPICGACMAQTRMMTIMRNTNSSARASAKEATHERIVSVAARAIRRSGYGGTGVADIMKEAGLDGAFYAHFASRDAMLAEAAGKACAESCAAVADVVAKAPPGMVLAMLAAYLSKEHVQRAEVAAFGPGFRLRARRRRCAAWPRAGQGNGRSHRSPITGLGQPAPTRARSSPCPPWSAAACCWLGRWTIRPCPTTCARQHYLAPASQ